MKHNISLRRSPRHNLIFVLILTPEMLEELENRARLCLQEVTRGFQYKILLHHEAPELQNKSTQRILEYQCPGILQWKCFTTDETDDKFSQKCFEIFNMTNMNTSQLPSLVNFKLTPKRIWTVILIFCFQMVKSLSFWYEMKLFFRNHRDIFRNEKNTTPYIRLHNFRQRMK